MGAGRRRAEGGGRRSEVERGSEVGRRRSEGSSRRPIRTTTARIAFTGSHGRQSAVSRLELVAGGGLSLEEAERWSYEEAKSSGLVYPSYYEKNADGISFRVAEWVRAMLPAEQVPPSDRQPSHTVHDIADWQAWCGGGPAVWDPVDAACVARWEAWQASGRREPPDGVDLSLALATHREAGASRSPRGRVRGFGGKGEREA